MKSAGVICAIDVNDFDPEVVDMAACFAELYGVDLDLVHVTSFPSSIDAAWPAYLGPPSELIKDRRLFDQIETSNGKVEIQRHQLFGLVVDQVVGIVERNQPRLLILGTHARSGLSRIFGSVAMKIMRKVSCPVMVHRQNQNAQSSTQTKAEDQGNEELKPAPPSRIKDAAGNSS